MKRIILFISLFFLIYTVAPVAVAQSSCNLAPKFINQDPFPAIPGEEVKLVFQLQGLGNPACGKVSFEIIEKFPISLEPGQESQIVVNSGSSSDRDFPSFLIAPYKVRVDETALDGENSVEVRYIHNFENSDLTQTKAFNFTVENVRADFEVSIKDYISSENTLILEILNIGESDVEALTVEIPKQENIEVKGSKRSIVGSLDSNEDTTLSFEAIPKEGEINLDIFYTDQINVRRSLQKTVDYDPSYFVNRAGDENNLSVSFYIIAAAVILIALYFIRKRWKKKREH